DFFFEAEDGIRYWSVTGVQTCALPICLARLDGAISSSAFFSNRIEPLSASIRIARGALVWNSSFFAPATVLAAWAAPSASAPTSNAAAGHARRRTLDQRLEPMRMQSRSETTRRD